MIDIEEGDVTLVQPVEENDEFDEIRVGLLPERLLTASIHVVHERRDAIGERKWTEIAVKRVVGVARLKPHLDVILAPAMPIENFFDLEAKVAFHLEDKCTNA